MVLMGIVDDDVDAILIGIVDDNVDAILIGNRILNGLA